MDMDNLIENLKEHRAFGSFAAIARVCGVSREAVRHWKRVPPEHCAAIEKHTDGEWTRARLRPDIFGYMTESPGPAPEAAADAAA